MAPARPSSKRPCASIKKLAPNPITSRKVKKEKQEKQIFKGLTISSVGQLRQTKGEISLEEIARWIRYHGGIYEKAVTENTTHLICSIEDYKKGGDQVRKAWKLGTQKCRIVVFDWVEDCLLAKPKRRYNEKPYSLDRTILNLKKTKASKLGDHRQKFDEGVRASRELCTSSLYHVYYDSDAFEYKVVLSRVRLDGKTMIEKYTLYLFESHNKAPPLYMFGAKLSRTCRPISYWRQDCHPMDFATAFQCFKKFFKMRSGVEWDDRLERIIPKKIENGKEVDHSFFKYLPPIQGRPVGLLPYGYVRPEERPMAPGPSGNPDLSYDTDSEVGDGDGDGGGDESGDSNDQGGSGASDASSPKAAPGDLANCAISISSDESDQ